MFTTGTRIQIREDGSTRAVEDLMISDLVFCPFSDKLIEIIDILCRTVDLTPSFVPDAANLTPIEIPVGAIAPNRPNKPLVVSPKQHTLMINQPKTAGELPSLEVVCADQAFPTVMRDTGRVTYYAIFLDSVRPLVANEALCMSYGPDVFSGSFECSGSRLNSQLVRW